MTIHTSARLVAGAAALAATVCAGAALAQQAAAPAGQAPQPLGGPATPGICILSREAVLTQSAVGRAVAARMQQLQQAVVTELQPEQNAVRTEAQAIQALPQGAARTQREQALTTRAQRLQQNIVQRNRELQATEVKALGRISTEAEPVVRQVYTQQRCGILLDRNSVLGANTTAEITQAVINGLNGRIQTFTFERERLPAQTQGQQQR
jgi:Skp family chaperone for outer membrane proteins